MRLLLDTRAFLWWSDDDQRLTGEAREAIADADLALISVASAWEAAIKAALGTLDLRLPFEDAVEENRFSKLSIDFSHAAVVGDLPLHHRDPFDRMLIAQALVEGLTVVTHDPRFEPYRVPIIWT